MKTTAILLLSLLVAANGSGSQRSLEGAAVPMTPPPMRMQGIHFSVKAKRGPTASQGTETVAGLKFYADDAPLFDERLIGVWCDKSEDGELLKDQYQRCIPLLADYEWDDAYSANKIEFRFENSGSADGQDSAIIFENEEFWFFNKNILQSATTDDASVMVNLQGKLTRLRTGYFEQEVVELHIPLAEPAEEIPLYFLIKATEPGTTLLKLKGVVDENTPPVVLSYDCTNTDTDMSTDDTISNDNWYECQADAAGNTFSGIIFSSLSLPAELKLGHFFYNRVNLMQTATEVGVGQRTDELGSGKLGSGQIVKMSIDPNDCRNLCCFVQEEYDPYPKCKLYCNESTCLRADKGTAYPTEHTCCEERKCKDRPENCWTPASYWPVRTCTADSTKCYQGNVYESEEDCCDQGTGAFPEGCTEIEGEFGPCWKQRSDANYPHCEKIRNVECQETDGTELENIALGRPIWTHNFYYSWYYYYYHKKQKVVDGSASSCIYSRLRGTKWVRIHLRDRKRPIDHVLLSTWYSTNNLEVRVGDSYSLQDNPVCTTTPTVSVNRGFTRIECTGFGRFLFVVQRTRARLWLCEVQIMAKHKYNDDVVSQGKAVMQSSHYSGRPPTLTVDGNVAMNSYYKCSRTYYQLKPSWGVDLETMRWITRLKIMRYYYYYYYGGRLYNIEIRIGPNSDYSQNPVVMLVPYIGRRVVELQLPKLVTGRYVSIHARGRARFDFCEVQVFAGPNAWGPSNYFPTEETCCNSNAFDNNACRVRPTTPCFRVAGWWPRRTCEEVDEEAICLRGWGVWDSRTECCNKGFEAGCSPE